MNLVISNDLAKTKKELKDYLTNEYKKLYRDFNNENLREIFSTLHSMIVVYFEEMNARIKRGNFYYIAQKSRELLLAIKIANELERQLQQTNLLFSIDKKYQAYFEKCLSFLQEYNGSLIPNDMQALDIYYEIPIFIPNDSIEIKNQQINYKLKLIGEGSYAKVFKYKDEAYQKYFVVKRALDSLSNDELQRFKQEFEIMKECHNPYIVEVYRYDENKKAYIMELVDSTLKNYIDKNNNKLGKSERKHIGLQILKAFKYLWNKEILHRDISPYNILIKQYDDLIVVKISDFGLVKLKDSELTNTKTEIKGSFNDISDLSKIGFKNYDKSHEIFALTKILYFVATWKINKDKRECRFFEKGTNGDKAK